ncbi:MAG: hypothetical protein KGJ02_06330 [Verrucomicrobiota bacterium]|nr:hypothetical protein [Verrucomicrobiota bacterium]
MFRIFVFCWFFLTVLGHASSYPYISENTWRDFSTWKLTDFAQFDPTAVKQGDTIFVKRRLLHEFERRYLPQISHPFILLTEGGKDTAWPQYHRALLASDKVLAWFLQNGNGQIHEKIHPLPMGLSGNEWNKSKIDDWHHWIRQSLLRKNKDFFAYLPSSTSMRLPGSRSSLEWLSSLSFVMVPKKTKLPHQYFQDLANSIFVLVYTEDGLDCPLIWEALLMGCFPVVKSSPLNSFYEGFPIVILERWEELTMDLLQAKYKEFKSQTWPREKLYAPYRFQIIHTLQTSCRKLS